MPFDIATQLAADFPKIARSIGLPAGTVTLRRVDRDTGDVLQSATSHAVYETTDGRPAAVGEGGEVYTQGRRWWVEAGNATWLTRGDRIKLGSAVYEVEAVTNIGGAVHAVETHYIGADE